MGDREIGVVSGRLPDNPEGLACMSLFFFFCSLSLHHTSCVGQTFNLFYSILAAVVFYLLNPLSPNSVQQQFSPNDIHTLS